MIALLTCTALFLVFGWLASAVADALSISALWIWLVYYMLSEVIESRRLTHMPSWRSSRFISFIGRTLLRTRFDERSRTYLQSLPLDRQYMFVCEPHGIACYHLVAGFAGHGGDGLRPEIAARTLVVAHQSFLFVPLLRNLYAVFGVIDERPATINSALDAGFSLALIPSALVGKWHSMLGSSLEQQPSDYGRHPTTVYRRESFGCFKYAHRRRMSVVPVLSPDEDYALTRYFTAYGFAPLVVTIGSLLVRPVIPLVEWRVGPRLASTDPGMTPQKLASLTYHELQQLGAATHSVAVERCGDSILNAMYTNKMHRTPVS
jgi:hypothetical protein